jgi:hypothetical protein
MAKRRGATARDPKYTTQPVKSGAEQVAGETNDVKGNMTAARRAASRMPTERLSPGVYRSAGGGLVTQKGRPIERQPQAPMQPAQPQNSGMQMDPGYYNPDLQQTTAAAQQLIGQMGQQVNKPYFIDNNELDPVARRIAERQRIATIGKTPPGWPGGQTNTMEYRYPDLQGMPQMPQASANQGGQYRLSPGVYGNQQQAMNQYNQQMQQMYQPMTMPQVRKG